MEAPFFYRSFYTFSRDENSTYYPLSYNCKPSKGNSLEITQNYLNLLVSDIQKDVEEFNILREFKREGIKMA